MKKFFSLTILSLLALLYAATVYSYGFGDNWQYAQCSYKKSGKTVWVNYKHVGVDRMAPAGKQVVVWDHIYFRQKHLDSNPQWRWAVVADTFDSKATYLFMHLENVPNFQSGEDLYGQVIGTVADQGSNSHIHASYRGKPFNSSMSYKGALPPSVCTDGRNGLPNYPEAFAPPNSWVYEIR